MLIFCGCGGGGGDDDDQQASFTVAGTISPAANAYIDSDVNDPDAPYAANDEFSQAQPLPNPVVVGGYVNSPGTGQDGRSFTAGDGDDYFSTRLFATQTIALNTVETGSRLNLYLYDATDSSKAVAEDTGLEPLKAIQVDQTGDYVIRIRAEEGASNYNLSIGSSGPTTSPLDIHTEFISGEGVVRFAEKTPTADDAAAFTAEFDDMGMALKSGAPGRASLLAFSPPLASRTYRPFSSQAQREFIETSLELFPGLVPKLDTLLQIEELRSRDDVIYAEPNYVRRASAAPDDTYYSLQWHYPVVNLPDAWEVDQGNPAVVVAVVDSGVVSHPDLDNQLTADGVDFISILELALDGDGIDGDPTDPGDQPQGGSTYHGTHVAGTVAAQTDNNQGVAGTGWSTRVMPLRALGFAGFGSSYDILQAVRYAAGLDNDYGSLPSQPADIINLSLGGDASSQAEQDVYDLIRQAGIIVIAAAGNNAARASSYPAAYDGVISVSAVDINGSPAPYSNFGPTIDTAAPGGDMTRDVDGDSWPDGVLSTGAVDSAGVLQIVYRFLQGTSMAAPHVAGIAALMKSVDPALTPDEFDAMLVAGSLTIDLGGVGRDDRYGYGLIDAQKAVLAALSGVVPTTLTVNPNAVNLGTDLTTAAVNVQKIGPGPLSITLVDNNADWLTVTANRVDIDDLGQYNLRADRSGLAPGIYTDAVTFASTANTVVVPVTLQVPVSISTPHIGNHYVLLLDPDTYETKYQSTVRSSNGKYHYAFSGVAAGSYIVFAGTNFDKDRFVGDAGESSGAYLALDQPVIVRVKKDTSGLNFSTEFNTSLSSSRTPPTGDAYIPLD